MSHDDHDDGVPWGSPESRKASPDDLTIDLSDDREMWQIRGTCPVCRARLDRDTRRELMAAMTPPWKRREPDALTIDCRCGHEHAGHPAGIDGCGWAKKYSIKAGA